VVLFFPDGIVGTLQKLMARMGGARQAAPSTPPVQGTPHPSPLPKGEQEAVR